MKESFLSFQRANNSLKIVFKIKEWIQNISQLRYYSPYSAKNNQFKNTDCSDYILVAAFKIFLMILKSKPVFLIIQLVESWKLNKYF